MNASREGTAVRTGNESRSELTFLDLTITRLGANTVFSFNEAGHNVQLGGGVVLLRVPKNSGGATIQGLAVTVGVTGTTVIFRSTTAGHSQLTVLEGGARLTLVQYPTESSTIGAGEMLDVPPDATKIPPPTRVDLSEIMKTEPLLTDFPPLPSQDLILAAARNQQGSGAGGGQPGPGPSQPTAGNATPPSGTAGPPRHTRPARTPSPGKPLPTPRRPKRPPASPGKPGLSPTPKGPRRPIASPKPQKSPSPKPGKNKGRPRATPTPKP